MDQETTIKNLYKVYCLIKEDNLPAAQQKFSEMKIVDTKEHLALPKNMRHLIWDLYEYLIINNTSYVSRKDIMDNFKILLAELI